MVLLEDAGALVGLALALLGVGLSMLTGNPAWDAAASIGIGALLCVVAFVLSAEMKSLLIGESASEANLQAIREVLESTPSVTRIIHMRTLHLGPEQILLGAKIEVDRTLDTVGVARVIDDAEARIRARVPQVTVIFLEPDLNRDH